MKGIILAGGTGSRLLPLTSIYNKNILPLGKNFLIDFPIQALKSAGIKDVLIITGPEHIGSLVGLIGSGSKYDINVTYRIQDNPNGIAAAIGLGESFANGDNVLVILGDNIFDDDLSNMSSHDDNACIAYYKVPDPERFGVLLTDENGKPTGVVEKPKVAPNNNAVVGIYSYPSDVFDKIKTLKPSARGEYEVTDLNNLYFNENRMNCFKLGGFWIDAGSHETYQKAFNWASQRQ